MSRVVRWLQNFFSLLLLVQIAACGGGGGGDDGRTRDTAIRIVHGAINSSPISVRGSNTDGVVDVLQTARYAESTAYIPIKDGLQTITVERANAPEVVYQSLTQDFKKGTEYSVFAYSNKVDGVLRFKIIEEPVEQPKKGNARIRFLNSSYEAGFVSITSDGLDITPINIGAASEFAEVPAGARHVEFKNANGKLLASKNIVIADRGDVYLLLSGSTQYDTFFVTSYEDLD